MARCELDSATSAPPRDDGADDCADPNNSLFCPYESAEAIDEVLVDLLLDPIALLSLNIVAFRTE